MIPLTLETEPTLPARMPVPHPAKLKPSPLRYRDAATDTQARIRPALRPNFEPPPESGNFVPVRRVWIGRPKARSIHTADEILSS